MEQGEGSMSDKRTELQKAEAAVYLAVALKLSQEARFAAWERLDETKRNEALRKGGKL
jgi:hypothetical protein